MKRLLYLATVMLCMWSCAPSENTLPRISVSGNQFVNTKGDTVVFKGLCLSDPVKMIAQGQYAERVIAEAADWGANVVRFPVHPKMINDYGWDSTFVALDRGIAWAEKHGMYAILDWHSIGNLRTEQFTRDIYITTWRETCRFWREAAKRYADNTTVAVYEIFNEPTTDHESLGPENWSEWRAMQEMLIDTIRTYAPEAVCLCAGFNWAYDLRPVMASSIRREQVAYCSHPYPMKREAPWEEKWEADWGHVAKTYPLLCTELGYCLEGEKGAHIPVIATDEYGDAITRYLDKIGASFTIWCFDPDWGPMLIADWDFTPTTQGRYFKAYLQANK